MSLLWRYVFQKCVMQAMIMATGFSLLYFTLNSVSELATLGKYHYTFIAMVIYLIALLPSYIYLLLPLAVLIGVMTTMLNLAKSSEYIVMRTSGLSLRNLVWNLCCVGGCFAILTAVIGELISPSSSTFARNYKLSKTSKLAATQLASGLWTKDGLQHIINIYSISSNGNGINGIKIFNFNKNLQLTEYITAKNANFNQNKHVWLLHDCTSVTYLTTNDLTTNVISKTYKTMLWDSSLTPQYLQILTSPPAEMSLISLQQYIAQLRHNQQSSNAYQIAWWNKICYPFNCISMALLALSFTPHSARNINFATKIFIGILIGIGFFLITKVISFLAILLQWNPLLSAIIPVLALLLTSCILVYHAEHA